jgi:glycosyltransferase involved in cell wall biosynthesis
MIDNQDIIQEGLVSIITPIYNGEKYIAETIESVLCQTYTNWEMLITDDGSTDKSAEIIRNYQEKEPRILFFQQKNAGSAVARNNGIRHAKGQYIALLDSDDIWEENFLKSQIDFLEEKNAILAYASYKRINEKSEECLMPLRARSSVTYKQMLLTNYIGCLTGLYDRTKYGKIYLREELKSLRDDYAYWLDIIRLVGIAYGNPEVLAKYRVFSSSTTGKKQKLIKAQFYFYNKYLGLGYFRSIIHVFYWAIFGFLNFESSEPYAHHYHRRFRLCRHPFNHTFPRCRSHRNHRRQERQQEVSSASPLCGCP